MHGPRRSLGIILLLAACGGSSKPAASPEAAAPGAKAPHAAIASLAGTWACTGSWPMVNAIGAQAVSFTASGTGMRAVWSREGGDIVASETWSVGDDNQLNIVSNDAGMMSYVLASKGDVGALASGLVVEGTASNKYKPAVVGAEHPPAVDQSLTLARPSADSLTIKHEDGDTGECRRARP